jgi:hypothetical protein
MSSTLESSPLTTLPVECNPGSVLGPNNVCIDCRAGTHSTSGNVCALCPQGTFSTVRSSVCKACPSGQTSREGASFCTPIVPSTTTPPPFATGTVVSSGTYSLESSTCPTGSELCFAKCFAGFSVGTSGSLNIFTSTYKGTDCECEVLQLTNGVGNGYTLSQSGTTVTATVSTSDTSTCTLTYNLGSVSAAKSKANSLLYLPMAILAMV